MTAKRTFTAEDIQDLLFYIGAERHYKGGIPTMVDHRNNASLYVTVELRENESAMLHASLVVSPMLDYTPPAYFMPDRTNYIGNDTRKEYSFKLPLYEHALFRAGVSTVTDALDEIHAPYAEEYVEDVDDAPFGSKQYYEEELAQVLLLVSLLSKNRLVLQSGNTHTEGFDCDDCGYSTSELQVTFATFDDSPLYCEIKGSWGCYSGMNYTETNGNKAKELWDSINASFHKPFWDVVAVAEKGNVEEYDY